jgi:hypothetical protein
MSKNFVLLFFNSNVGNENSSTEKMRNLQAYCPKMAKLIFLSKIHKKLCKINDK